MSRIANLRGEGIEALGRGHVVGLVVQPVEKIGHSPAAVGREELLERRTGEVAVFAIAHLRARGADDAQAFRQQAVGVERAQGR